jgi:hypothetical protein
VSRTPDKGALWTDSFKRAFAMTFLAVPLGGFCFFHLMFLAGMMNFGKGGAKSFIAEGAEALSLFAAPSMLLPVALMFLSHGIAFFKEFIGREEYRHSPGFGRDWRSHPFLRVVVLHVSLIAGGLFLILFPPIFAALLVLLKCAVDVLLDRVARKTRQEPTPASSESAPTSAGWRHAEAFRRMATTGVWLLVIGAVFGLLGSQYLKPRLSIKRQAEATVARMTPGLSLRDAIETAGPWTYVYTEGKPSPLIISRDGPTAQKCRLTLLEGKMRTLSTPSMLARLDAQPPDLVAARSMTISYNLKNPHSWSDFRFTVNFGHDGRVRDCSGPIYRNGHAWWEP